MTKKPKLTDLDLVLLSSAAARPDGMLLPPPESVRARGKTLEKALGKLLRLELVEDCPAATPEQAWREDEGRGIALRISDTGRAALGVDEAPDDQKDEPAHAASTEEAAEEVKAESASDTEETGGDVNRPVPFAPGIKPGTKQARLVDYLSRPWGMSIADLSRLLGWQPHTVRAALTGLRKKGYQVTSANDDKGTVVYRATPPVKVTTDA